MTSEKSAQCPPAIVIAGSASGVGKSSLSIGLMAALCERGMVVQPFKVGPDFVDPLYHGRATGRPSVNLDRWFSSPDALRKSWEKYSDGSGFCVIEGTTGLLDDIGCPKVEDDNADLLPYNTAQLAKWLDIPVVLVMDGSKLENSIGALVRGYCTWDTRVEICGIIFNNVRDYDDLAELEAIVHSACPTKIPILGGVPNDDVFLNSDLESAFDASVINKKIVNLCSLVSQNVDVDKILSLARTAGRRTQVIPGLEQKQPEVNVQAVAVEQTHHVSKNAKRKARRKRAKAAKVDPIDQSEAIQSNEESDNASCSASHSTDASVAAKQSCRIAVAKDSAINFYYEENLDLLRDKGMEIVYFSPLTDALPQNISAVYMGGGVPELHAAALADNKIFRAGMRKFVEAGGIVFAEGGGFLVLCQSLQTRTGFPQQPMVGIFPFRAIMSKTKVMRGYVQVSVAEDCPIFPGGSNIRAYMNSNSELVQEQHIGGIISTSEWRSTYNAKLFQNKHSNRIHSMTDGYCTSNVLGSYFHHHFGNSPDLIKHFVAKCQKVNVSAVTSAVASARRMAEYLEGSVAYTPPLTPVRGRNNFGMLGVHSSPELNLDRRARSRPHSMDLNGTQYDFTSMTMPDRAFHMTKTQSSGSLGHRTAIDIGGYDQKSSGAASPVQLGSANDLTASVLPSRSHFIRVQQNGIENGRVDNDRQFFPRISHERYQHRLSNNSDCLSSDGSELAERSSSGLLNTYKPVENIVQNAGKFQESGNQYFRQAAQYLDVGTPGPYGDHINQKSIAVCDPGVRDIIQAFDIQASRLIDVSRHGLGSPIVSDRSLGMLQSKSVQALQNLHARRNSSDAGSESSFGEGLIENVARSIYRRSQPGVVDIDFEAIAQVKPDVLILHTGKTSDEIMGRINRMSPKTRVLKVSPHSLSDVIDVILQVGAAIQERDQAVTIVKKLRERLRKVVIYSQKAQASMGFRTHKIAVLSSLHPLSVEGGWVNDLVGLVGGEPLTTNGQKKRIISWGDLVAFAPSVLIVCAPIMNSGDKSAKVFNDLCDIAAQPGWWQLPAVRDGVVVICEEALLSRMGLRLIDGAEALTRIIYGDHVPTCCLPRSTFKLKLRPGQRVRPRLLPNYFMAYA